MKETIRLTKKDLDDIYVDHIEFSDEERELFSGFGKVDELSTYEQLVKYVDDYIEETGLPPTGIRLSQDTLERLLKEYPSCLNIAVFLNLPSEYTLTISGYTLNLISTIEPYVVEIF